MLKRQEWLCRLTDNESGVSISFVFAFVAQLVFKLCVRLALTGNILKKLEAAL